jgi:hypothetical protein
MDVRLYAEISLAYAKNGSGISDKYDHVHFLQRYPFLFAFKSEQIMYKHSPLILILNIFITIKHETLI